MWKTAFIVTLLGLTLPAILGVHGASAPLIVYYVIALIFVVIFGTGVADLWFGSFSRWRDRGIIVGTIACIAAIGVLESIGILGWAEGLLQGAVLRYHEQVHNLAAKPVPPDYFSIVFHAILVLLAIGIGTSVVLIPVMIVTNRSGDRAKPPKSTAPTNPI